MSERLPLRVFSSPTCVSVSAPIPGIVCDANCIDGETWNVCRVFLAPKFRRKGYGRELLSLLFEELRKFPAAQRVTVYPGGYDMSPEEQFAFYRACGFVDIPTGGLVFNLR